MHEPIRLSKCVAALKGCSRREAEQYIEGGWVRVNGHVVEEPQARVQHERVEIDPHARLSDLLPVTLLLHKPACAEAGLGALPNSPRAAAWLTPANRAAAVDAHRPLKRHFKHQVLVTPLPPNASGLVVFTQDGRVARKLREDAAWLEHEWVVDVSGAMEPGGLARLNRPDHGILLGGRPLGPCKVSWQSEARLRFALKGEQPGQVARLCEAVGLQVQAMRRLRIGRVALGRLVPGQWRYLGLHERF